MNIGPGHFMVNCVILNRPAVFAALLLIIIEFIFVDINDNTPQFTNDTYTFLVDENVALSSVVGQVLAIDSDSNGAGMSHICLLVRFFFK